MLLEVTLELCGQARALTFVVEYALTHTRYVGEAHAFWIALDRVVKEVPEHEQLFVLWTQTRGRDGGKRGSGGVRSVKFSVPTAEILSTIMATHFIFCQSWACTVEYFLQYHQELNFAYYVQPARHKCIDYIYILMRQRDGNLVRMLLCTPQPSFLPSSDDNIVKHMGSFLVASFATDRRRLTNHINKGGFPKWLRRRERTDCRVGMDGSRPDRSRDQHGMAARRAAWKW